MDRVKTLAKQRFSDAVGIIGSQSEMARQLTEELGRKIYQCHVRKWMHETLLIPDYVCKPVEKLTNGEVKKHELRPDLWDAPEVVT